MTDGFLLVDKPEGWTSHDVVDHTRRVSGERKIGHGGTLDPPATGLLVLGLGRCTRLLRFVQQLPKWYEARLVFGIATDTLDASGAVLSREPMPITEEDLQDVLGRFHGVILQVPPMVSALRVEGTRLYSLARRGHEVSRPARSVEVYEIALDDFSPGDYPEATIRVCCGKGTYVRSLADDIAQALGGRAHLGALRRTSIGSHRVNGAPGPLELTKERIDAVLLLPAEGLRDLPAVSLVPEQAAAVRHGMPIMVKPGNGEVCRLLDEEGALLAVYRRSGRTLIPEVVLA